MLSQKGEKNIWRISGPFVILLLPFLLHGAPSTQPSLDERRTANLQEYLRIPSQSRVPNSGYRQAVTWLEKQATELGLEFNYLDLGPNADFAVWMTWRGLVPALPSVFLNSHLDVVHVEPEYWTYPPFDAHIDDAGFIYARGATDMKSTTVAEIEALRNLKRSGFKPLRTIHLSVLPDEEYGGYRGMIPFTKTPQFRTLHIGVAISEGGCSKAEAEVFAGYVDKNLWMFNITARGKAMHSFWLPPYTAAHRLNYVITKIFEFRDTQLELMSNGASLADVTSVNLVKTGGGFANNILPHSVWALFDLRIRSKPGWTFDDMENLLATIVEQANLGWTPADGDKFVEIDYISQWKLTGQTVADDRNPWWTVLQEACSEMKVTCPPRASSGVGDGRHLREFGIPTFGLCLFPNGTGMPHVDNERIYGPSFLRGIPRWETLIRKLSSAPSHKTFEDSSPESLGPEQFPEVPDDRGIMLGDCI